MNDYKEGEFYCFCNKVKKRCTLCKMSSAFSRDKMKAEELLERFQHNHDELKKLADEMWPYFEETFILDFFLWASLIRNITGLHETETTSHTVT